MSDTAWRAEVRGRTYKGKHVWVEEMYNTDPKWTWSCECGAEQRASTQLQACADAEAHARGPCR
jgi:hypothetical protein